jgi:hypothetical protein
MVLQAARDDDAGFDNGAWMLNQQEKELVHA